METTNYLGSITRDSFPVTIFETKKSILFGLIKFWIIIENRRPDLPDENPAGISKYKTQFKVNILFFKFYFLARSIYAPTITTNNETYYRQ